MMAAPRLDDHERDRLLGLIGIERYVRRSTLPVTAEPDVVASTAATTRAPATPKTSRPMPPPVTRVADAKASTRPSLIAELGLDARLPQVLVFVETPRAPDPRGVRLLDAICRLLPPHQRLDANDLPARWTDTAIALGGQVNPPKDTQLIQSLPLHELRGSVAAKRALWQSIKRLRRGLNSR